MSGDSKIRLKALFEMATDGIITMNKGGVIENVNRAACELFGYTVGEMEGQKVNMLMANHDRTHHDQYLERYQRTRVPHIIGTGREVTGRCKDGREFPLRIAVSEAILGEDTIYTGMLHDLSEFHLARKRIEDLNHDLERKVIDRTAALHEREAELRRALGKERKLSELKSRFMSIASHEFKTPLSTVLSSTELVEMYTASAQQPMRQKHLDRIKVAVGQLTEILNDFLSLNQLEQGVIQCVMQSVNLKCLLSKSIDNTAALLRPGQVVELRTDHLPQRIFSDPKLLGHVLDNLLSNAAKYSPADSPVILGGSIIGDRLVLSVRDFGIGIPDEDQTYLFDSFYRAHNVENIKGSGLGLNIVAHYVDLLKGKVTFTSKENVGTTFTLELPLEITAD